MTGSRCDTCGAPLNYALSHCAYCGSPIAQKFGTAFPVRCPWNGTKTCGDCADYHASERGRIYHCAHCHASEPHPMSPEGKLLHAAVRFANGCQEAVCQECFAVAPLQTARPARPDDLYEVGKDGFSQRTHWWPFDDSLCAKCFAIQEPKVEAWEAERDKERAGKEAAAPQTQVTDSLPQGWFARRRAAKEKT
jgi:hypothetical protein